MSMVQVWLVKSICRWPRPGHGLDPEALRLPQVYPTHNQDPLPLQCAWLFADASWHMSSQKERDEGKAISRQRGGQREKALGSSPSLGPVYFISWRGLIGLTVSHRHGQCLNTALCVQVCFQGVIWHFCAGMYWCKWDKERHPEMCSSRSLFHPSSSISLEGWKPSKKEINYFCPRWLNFLTFPSHDKVTA